ncbi:MAG: GNAT family N-acetyltransferase [Candidatus Saccharibacteria bacterium]|nr:GNAT family N-acetyltransferase [Candidatus Saccharibacteria bacterium]
MSNPEFCPEPPQRVTFRGIETGPNDLQLEFEIDDYTYLNATHNTITGMFGIATVNVRPDLRRQGVGTRLLQAAFDTALDYEARFIHATLRSRESIDLMQGFFGKDAVSIDRLGSYAQDYVPDFANNNAKLFFEIDPSEL